MRLCVCGGPSKFGDSGVGQWCGVVWDSGVGQWCGGYGRERNVNDQIADPSFATAAMHELPRPCVIPSRSQETFDAISYGSEALSIIILTGVNLMLPWLLTILTKIERNPTESKAAQSLTFSLFLTYFLNSAFSYILANAYIPSANTSGSVFFFSGYFSDFTPGDD